jgi:hypothetical protein
MRHLAISLQRALWATLAHVDGRFPGPGRSGGNRRSPSVFCPR